MNYNYVEEIDELKNRINELEVLAGLRKPKRPKPNTKDEWKMFATHWADGGWNTMQWYDASKNSDNEWYDFEEDEAFYPYDEKLIIRFKSEHRLKTTFELSEENDYD
jgi:hypothetical protein